MLEDTYDRVVQVVAQVLEVPPSKISGSTSFLDDLGAEPEDVVEVIMDLEEEFGVSVADEDVSGLNTVAKVVNYINAKLKRGGSSPQSPQLISSQPSMFCNECGNPNPSSSKFCSSCGSQLVAPPALATAPPQAIAPFQAPSAPLPTASSAVQPRPQASPSSPGVQLTAEERQHLIFQEGDYYEVLSGVLSISSQRTGPHAKTGVEVNQVSFFFESSHPGWGTQEWTTTFAGSIPEGPALLVLYRRGQVADPFGIVSMNNRAWTHIVPILGATLIEDSTKAKELKALQMKSIGGAVVGSIAAAALSSFTFGIGAKNVAKKVGYASGLGSYREAAEKIETTVRSFMYRISRDADKYWPGGQTGGGRL